ncbi:tyrosine-type recombinase/integrase, partial [uncultured Muribaculum sp.]
MAQQPFKKWVKAAGIERKLSFHCLRHSFAMLLISLDIDVSVVSKMFTHRSVKTTMIYADVVSEKKRG